MVIVMQHGASANQIAAIVSRVESIGYRAHLVQGEERTIIGVIGYDRPIDRSQLALHYTMLEQADALAADTLGADNVERGDFVYLGPTFFVFEHLKDGRRVLTDPTIGQSADKEVVRSGLSGKSVTPKADPAEAWQFISDRVGGGGDLMAGDVLSGGATSAIGGVPFYHQDDYGPNSCAPTASAQVLGYWDDHGYGNLIDNGRSNTGDERQLVYDLMEAEGFDPNIGTYGNMIRPGILSTIYRHNFYSF